MRTLCLLVLLIALGVSAYDWTPVEDVLNNQIEIGAFPGCVAMVASKDILFAKAFGNFTYGDPAPRTGTNPPMELDTMFDMASCTKVVATTTAVMQFYQRGEIDLDMRVSDPTLLGPAFAANGKETITVRNLLLHDSGFPADPVPFYNTAAYGCPETKEYHPGEVFTCRGKIFQSVMDQKLINPVGAVYLYSDLSMITLMYVVGTLARANHYVGMDSLLPACAAAGPVGIEQCYFEAYVRNYVFGPLKMPDSGFLPPAEKWKRCAPCENDTTYMHSVIQGQVSDGNAYALGGIAGHAGLFSTAPDVMVLMQRLMFAGSDDSYVNRTTVDYFTREYNHSQSSRALGWNTNDPTVPDMGWNLACGHLSPKTYMHLGYTGTQICADPVHQVITVLLTNRVYPTAANTKITAARKLYNDAVVNVLKLDNTISIHTPNKP